MSFQLTSREWNYWRTNAYNLQLTTNEVEFLDKVDKGDIDAVKSILQSVPQSLNINCEGKRRGKLMTPLQIAAINDDYDMTKLLLDKGASHLIRPRVENGKDNDIRYDECRLELYQALCSPVYISLAYNDPIVTSMDLSAELASLANARDTVDTSKEEYVRLKAQVDAFIVDIIENCESSAEVKILLRGNLSNTEEQSCLNVLTKAVEIEHMQFVAHRKCHRVARDEWLKGQPQWHRKHGFGWTVLYHIYCVLVYLFLLPFLAAIYIIAPCSPVRYVLDTPKAKFVMQFLSYLLFLFLILVMGFYFNTANALGERIISYCILVHSVGLLWTEIVRMYTFGMKSYFSDLWNLLHLVVVFDAIFRVITRQLYENYNLGFSFLIYLGTSSGVCLTLICIRVLQCLHLNPYLGPVLLLFLAMTDDVIKFILIFAYTVLAFGLGFYYLYFRQLVQFDDINSSVMTLMSMIFGSDPSESIINVNVKYNTSSGILDGTTYFEVFGYTLYVSFGLVALVILLNICIAMMSDTYSRLQQDIDTHWRFYRTKLWLNYMHADSPVLPAPYNIIPSVPCLMYIWERCRRGQSVRPVVDIELTTTKESGDSIREEQANYISYTELTRVLMCRYLMHKNKIQDPRKIHERKYETKVRNNNEVNGHSHRSREEDERRRRKRKHRERRKLAKLGDLQHSETLVHEINS